MKIQFSTDNASFQEYTYPNSEIARTLRKVAERIEHGETAGNIRDTNGNTIGQFDTTI